MALNPAMPARLVGLEQATTAARNSATTSATYRHNTAGDMLGDGWTSYRFDNEGHMESARNHRR